MPNKAFTQAIELLKLGQPRQAEALCRKTLAGDVEDINMLGLLGVIQLKTGRFDEAEATLGKTIEIEPQFAQPHEDLAGLYMHLNEPAKAEPLFRRVTELEPHSSSAWRGLAHALRALGELERAGQAMQRSNELSPLNPLLERAERLCDQGEHSQARDLCQRTLTQQPDNIPALYQLAIIEEKLGNTAVTESILKKIVELAPGEARALSSLARFYTEHHHYVESIDCLKRMVKLDPSDIDTQLELATSLSNMGLPDQALQAFEAARELDSAAESGRLGRAHTLRSLGRSTEAVEAYQQCIAENSGGAAPWWGLASLRTYSFSEDELRKMRSVKTSSVLDKAYLDFAMGKALDDRGEFDLAWQCYTRGNEAKRGELYHDVVAAESEINAIIESSDRLLNSVPGNKHHSTTPIFILGMPRSGSTLLEQILASHSQVEATSELAYILGLGKPHLTYGPRNSQPSIIDFSDRQILELGDKYLEATKLHRPQGSAYFIDKMPDNFQMIGLISRALPQAKIIDARRHPLDTCVGNYRQLYAQGKNFSYDLFELGQYYLQYWRLMKHWDDQLPGQVLCVNYEELVANTEQEISRLLTFCGLPWEDDCLNFHQTQRGITSASSEQVRQPIYTSAIGFWKNYEHNLDELIELLQPAMEAKQLDARRCS